MTDQPQQDDNNLVVRDASGDPVPLGTRMIEKESYERVIEGLKIAAEGAAHLAVHEYDSRNINGVNLYSALAKRLDLARRIAVERAAIDETVMRQRETELVRGQPMRYREAKRRFREGIKQAAGGMRQLATCHRGDFVWSKMAGDLEGMLAKLTGKPSSMLRPIMPPTPSLLVH